VKIQSKNFPDHFFGGANPAAISTGASVLNVVSPGLTGAAGTVSFQSAAQPNSYLRHLNSILYLEDKNTGRNLNIFDQDATFRIVSDKFFPGFVSFESVNYPGKFLRHQGYTLKLHPDDGGDLMHNDASFKILPTGENAPAAPSKYNPAPFLSNRF
jgi:arabinan endo-1,5-alpha-L-arabinosidase